MKYEFLNIVCNLVLFASLLTIAESCEKDKIAIGNTYQGGIIFYIDGTREHGLVATPRDQGIYQWGCTLFNLTGADGSEVGTGYQNTLDIVNGCPDTDAAAFNCANLE